MPLLNPGDPFPRMTISTIDDQALTTPDAFAGSYAAVLFYRGAWCPYRKAQLRAFERAGEALADAGVRVAALSVDDEETTATLVARYKLTFPVGYGADAAAVAELTGAFVNPDPVYLQTTGFVLDPAGNVVVSVYSSGAIGRLVPDDVTGLVRYLRQHAAGWPPTGQTYRVRVECVRRKIHDPADRCRRSDRAAPYSAEPEAGAACCREARRS